jgi:hypothetical protein
MSNDNLPGPGDYWFCEPEWQGNPVRRPAVEREPREYGQYTGACLRWNPVTCCAEPGTFTVHEADFIGGSK